MTVHVEVAAGARTARGGGRRVNQDAVLAAFPVYAVADGMGGHDAGERASAAVLAALTPLRGRRDVRPEEVVAALEHARASVSTIARQSRRGAGSTVSAVVAVVQLGAPVWLLCHAGDSRVYRLTGSTLERLTADHSVVGELLAVGAIGPREARRHPERHVLTRAIGDGPGGPEFRLAPIVTGERLLVCADGLSDVLGDEGLRAGLAMGGGAQQTADALVALALDRGARDDMSAVVVDVREGAVAPRADDVTGGYGTSAQAARGDLPGTGEGT